MKTQSKAHRLLASTMLTLPLLMQATMPSALAQTRSAGQIGSMSNDDTDPNGGENIVVHGSAAISANRVTGRAVGGGLIQRQDAPKSVSAVSTDFIQKQTATSSTFQLLRLTPGANSAGSDPYNMQYGGGGFSVRGLDSSQIGFTFEGLPLNSVYNNSVNPAEWSDNENLRTVRIAQGSPDLASPALNASGGVVNLFTLDPARKFGGFVDVSGGSYSMARGFVRLDTGEIGNSGFSAFASISQTEADHTRGAGHDSKTHFDLGVLKTFANGSRTKLAIAFSDINITNYNYPTLANYRRYGRSNNYSSVFTGSNGNYYKLHTNPYNSVLVSLPSDIVLNHNLNVNFTPYTYYFYGTTGFGANVNEASIYSGTERFAQDLNGDGVARGNTLVYTPSIEQESRTGFQTRINYTLGHNSFVLGHWFQYDNDNLFSQYGKVTNGIPNSPYGDQDVYHMANGNPIYQLASHSYAVTNALYVGDTVNLMQDRLRIDVGFREAMISRDGRNLLPGTQYRTGLNVAEPLPVAAIRYKIDPNNQIFASASTAFRSPPAAAFFQSAYGGRVTGVANTNVKSEYSISEEAGYRYQSSRLIASATFFNYNFTNRLISTTVFRNGLQYASALNGGGQTGRGVDVELGTGQIHHFRPYLSGEYLHTTIDNNLASGADYLPTTGKTAVRSPKFQFGLGLDYDNGTFFGNASVKWVDSQYSTFMNDQSIPSYVVADFTAGARLPNVGGLRHPELRLNIVNAADNNYLSGAYSVNANALATRGVFGTRIAGSNPAYFIGTPFIAMVTLSGGF